MYRNFFALSDLPFSIAPDPKYLFMSERHKEALSHLTYGLGDIGGFALLTGEVGTGKTTVSRCLMEQLPENTQAAFILNPMLSSQELLATLCDELTIEYKHEDVSLKSLTDKISEKLLANHAKGINTLLIIDEAQHLQPEVLEQLRLLTNLETNTKKLLQVVLIGQPELQQLLQRRDLRQLAQRITARYHLMPLTKQEVAQYIDHRLTIADCARKLFDEGAISKIHQLSEGIPRIINLLCHSALMLAYNQNDSIVNKKIVSAAAENVLGTLNTKQTSFYTAPKVQTLITTVSVLAFISLASFWWGQDIQKNELQVTTLPTVQKEAERVKQPLDVTEKNETVVFNNEEPTVVPEKNHDESMPVNTEPDDSTLLVADKNSSATSSKEDLTEFVAVPNVAIHTVEYGDNLYSISVKYNTKIKALREWNNLAEAEEIIVGEELFVSDPKNGEIMLLASDEVIKDTETKKAPVNQNRFDEADTNLQQVDGVSDDLLALFQAAIDETDRESTTTVQHKRKENDFNRSDNSIKSINQLTPSQQDALPKMQFEQHIYSSDGQGWVTVNGRDRYEGDYINAELSVEKILPQAVILNFRGDRFSIPALTNW